MILYWHCLVASSLSMRSKDSRHRTVPLAGVLTSHAATAPSPAAGSVLKHALTSSLSHRNPFRRVPCPTGQMIARYLASGCKNPKSIDGVPSCASPAGVQADPSSDVADIPNAFSDVSVLSMSMLNRTAQTHARYGGHVNGSSILG